MVIPFGPMTPTILDISTIIGTPPSRIPVDAALIGCLSNLDLKALFDDRAVETLSQEGQEPSKDDVQKLHKNFLNYNTLIIHFTGRGEASLRKGNTRPSYFTGTTSSSVIPSRINAWSRICRWRKPWLVNISSTWMSFLMMNFLYVIVKNTPATSDFPHRLGMKVKMPLFVKTGGRSS
ncbi:hypothetical protein ACFX2B_037534 [Malus domestica]